MKIFNATRTSYEWDYHETDYIFTFLSKHEYIYSHPFPNWQDGLRPTWYEPALLNIHKGTEYNTNDYVSLYIRYHIFQFISGFPFEISRKYLSDNIYEEDYSVQHA